MNATDVRKKDLYSAARTYSVALTSIERELHNAKLHQTAAKVNEAIQRLGWEIENELARIQKEERDA